MAAFDPGGTGWNRSPRPTRAGFRTGAGLLPGSGALAARRDRARGAGGRPGLVELVHGPARGDRRGPALRRRGPDRRAGTPLQATVRVETVRLVPTARVLKEEFGFRTVATPAGQRTQYATRPSGRVPDADGDLNVIDVQWIVQYRIEDPIHFLFHVRNTRQTIRDIAEAVMRRVVGNRWGAMCSPWAAWRSPPRSRRRCRRSSRRTRRASAW